jgi:hypothetical protein
MQSTGTGWTTGMNAGIFAGFDPAIFSLPKPPVFVGLENMRDLRLISDDKQRSEYNMANKTRRAPGHPSGARHRARPSVITDCALSLSIFAKTDSDPSSLAAAREDTDGAALPANMQPIAIMLDLVQPVRPGRRDCGLGWDGGLGTPTGQRPFSLRFAQCIIGRESK